MVTFGVCTFYIKQIYCVWKIDCERKTILNTYIWKIEEMANEIIIELVQLLPVVTIALIALTLYIMYICQERIKRIFICS